MLVVPGIKSCLQRACETLCLEPFPTTFPPITEPISWDWVWNEGTIDSGTQKILGLVRLQCQESTACIRAHLPVNKVGGASAGLSDGRLKLPLTPPLR